MKRRAVTMTTLTAFRPLPLRRLATRKWMHNVGAAARAREGSPGSRFRGVMGRWESWGCGPKRKGVFWRLKELLWWAVGTITLRSQWWKDTHVCVLLPLRHTQIATPTSIRTSKSLSDSKTFWSDPSGRPNQRSATPAMRRAVWACLSWSSSSSNSFTLISTSSSFSSSANQHLLFINAGLAWSPRVGTPPRLLFHWRRLQGMLFAWVADTR